MHAESEELTLPIFPLPGLVFFPETRIPLHIFEPRYRQMIADALESDRKIGMILLQPGWESEYLGNPAVHSYGTLGTIEQVTELEDGRYNLILRGDSRFRILEMIPHDGYRKARIVLDPETPCSGADAEAQRQMLVTLASDYLELLPSPDEIPEMHTASLEALTNAIIMSLNLTPQEKQILLELPGMKERSSSLGEELSRRIETLSFLHPFRHTSADPSNN